MIGLSLIFESIQFDDLFTRMYSPFDKDCKCETPPNFKRIVHIGSLSFIVLSSLSAIIVLISLYLKKRNEKKTTKYQASKPFGKHIMFTELIQFSITSLIVADLIFSLTYTVTQSCLVIFFDYLLLPKSLQITMQISSTIAEGFFIAGGVWSLLISL